MDLPHAPSSGPRSGHSLPIWDLSVICTHRSSRPPTEHGGWARPPRGGVSTDSPAQRARGVRLSALLSGQGPTVGTRCRQEM